MRRIMAAVMAVIVMISVMTAGCGSGNPGHTDPHQSSQTETTGTEKEDNKEDNTETIQETTSQVVSPVDEIPLETLLFLFSDMVARINLDYCVRAPLTQEEIGYVVGDPEFTVSFAEGMTLAPEMSIDPFVLVVLRLEEGQDGSAIADDMMKHANLNKWVCVSAETAKALASERTVVFFMSDKMVAEELENIFATMCEPGFRVEDYLKYPLKDKSVRDLYDELYEVNGTDNYGFLDGQELGTASEGLPEGFTLPEGLKEAEMLWDVSMNEGDQSDPARSSFLLILQDKNVGDETAAQNNAKELYEALQSVKLPLGEEMEYSVAYSAEYGIYTAFAATGSWMYSTYNVDSTMKNIYRMEIYHPAE